MISPCGIDDVAVAVADAVGVREALVLAERRRCCRGRSRRRFSTARAAWSARTFLKWPISAVLADVVVVRREDDLRPLQGQDARRLDVPAVGADDDAELHAAALEDRELAALLVELHVGRALAVGAEEVPLVDDGGGVVQVAAAQLVEADDRASPRSGRCGRAAPSSAASRAANACLRGDLLGVRVAGQEALGEADDLDAVAVGPLRARGRPWRGCRRSRRSGNRTGSGRSAWRILESGPPRLHTLHLLLNQGCLLLLLRVPQVRNRLLVHLQAVAIRLAPALRRDLGTNSIRNFAVASLPPVYLRDVSSSFSHNLGM